MTFDARDAAIRDYRVALWNTRNGPRVGDFVIMPNGETLRFTHDWGPDIQTTCKGGKFGSGSFYFGDGHMSYSGALDPALLKSAMIDTGEVRDGRCWFFHHDHAGAHRGVDMTVPCRVYRYEPKRKESD